MTRVETVRALYRDRPRNSFARLSAWLLLAIVVGSWMFGGFDVSSWASARARANLDRFLSEIRPYPLQGKSWDWGEYWRWFRGTIGESLPEALVSTLSLSVVAVVLAGVLGALLAVSAARTMMRRDPFGAISSSPGDGMVWGLVVGLTRLVLMGLRAIPEYIWAYLLLALLGVGPWPAALALALHNGGILGKLYSETLENVSSSTPGALRAIGATRLSVVGVGIVPTYLGRFLLYFFYRWETCVREATVLGLLGFISLGWFIQEARAGVRYDEMIHYVLLGSLLILIGDQVSDQVRRAVR